MSAQVRHPASVRNAYNLYCLLPLIISRTGVFEYQPAHLNEDLLGVWQMINRVECLVLAGRLDDESAEPEEPAHGGPLEAHVGDLGQGHHVHGLLKYAGGEQEPCGCYYEVIFEPLVDVEKQIDDE